MSSRIQYEPMSAKQILNPVSAASMPFSWSINPYRGCQHGCSFCYARSTHSFLGVQADDSFQNHIFVKENAAEVLEKQLAAHARSRKGLKGLGSIAIGTATDPYQPVEAKAKLTRQMLELLAQYRVSASITTRSPLILRDLDILRRIPGLTVNISINTLNTKVWKQTEPATPFPIKRLETVRELVGNGIDAGIFAAPLLPYLTDSEEELERLLSTAARYRPQFVVPSFLRLSTSEVKSWFFLMLEEHFPELLQRYAKLYARSGTAEHSYRDQAMRRVQRLMQRYGLTARFRREPEAGSAEDGAGAKAAETRTEPVQLSFPI
ncbi:SPL family radical SAM protein [Paenibacillus senegalensis]|uniref:SPL family radical SAM protein n=1 Tax=Paenibacillus senegalensis TaxID=1465766 RepID=UPI000287ADB9|nr:radical SAM protein [Paenibacillus senegalensis]